MLFKYTIVIFISIQAIISASANQHPLACADLSPYSNMTNPVYLYHNQEITTKASYANPYNIEGVYNYSLQGITTIYKIPFSVLLNRFGVTEYNEDTLDFLTCYQIANSLYAGYTHRFLRVKISNENFEKHKYKQNGDISFLLKLTDYLSMGFYQKNILTYYHKDKKDLLPPERVLGLNLKISRGISLSYNFCQVYYGNISSYHVTANLLPVFRISAGYSTQTSTYSLSSEAIFYDLNINYNLSYHSYLGTTHTFAIGWSSKEIEFDPMNYQRQHRRSHRIIKINIQNCSLEELKKVPELNIEIARRIIKYREIFGKLNKKSLIQLGLNHNQIKNISKYITGLEKNSINNHKQRRYNTRIKYKNIFRFNTLKKQKKLFELLIKANFSYSKAFSAVRIAKYKTIPVFLEKLKKTKNFSLHEIKKVKKICKVFT